MRSMAAMIGQDHPSTSVEVIRAYTSHDSCLSGYPQHKVHLTGHNPIDVTKILAKDGSYGPTGDCSPSCPPHRRRSRPSSFQDETCCAEEVLEGAFVEVTWRRGTPQGVAES